MGIAKNNSRPMANEGTEKWRYWKTTVLENDGSKVLSMVGVLIMQINKDNLLI